MRAVYRRELKSSAVSMTGAAAVAVMLFVIGLMFRYINLTGGYAAFAYAIANSNLIYFIVVPVLGARVFSEEFRSGRDVLFMGAPGGIEAAVFGKYLALLTTLALPCAVSCLCPVFMASLGAQTAALDYANILIFFLMGAAYLAFAMFFSTLTASGLISSVLSIGFVFLTMMVHQVYVLLTGTSFEALVILVVLSLAAGGVIYLLTRRYYVSLGAAAALAVLAFGFYFLAPDLIAPLPEKLLYAMDFYARSSVFTQGTFDVGGVVYFVSAAAAGVFLTLVSLRVRRDGAYPGKLAALLLLASVVLINSVAALLPASLMRHDISAQSLFTLTEESKNLLASLTEDMHLYYLTETGRRDATIRELLNSYEAASDRVHVEEVNVLEHPTFTEAYTDEDVSLNSVIVEIGDKSAVVPFESMYVYDSGGFYTQAVGFDAEGQISAAAASLLRSKSVHVYVTGGHGEASTAGLMEDAMTKAGMTVSPIRLLAEDIPGDCAALIVFAPTSDFTEEEIGKMRAYLYSGGRAFICTMVNIDTPRLDDLLKEYGIARIPGYVAEGDSAHFTQAPYILLPEIGCSDIVSGLNRLNLIYPLAQGIEILESEEWTLAVTPLLSSSEDSWTKRMDAETLRRETGDADGPFTLAVSVEETMSAGSFGEADVELPEEYLEEEEGETVSTRIVYATTPCAFSAEVLSALVGGDVSMPEGNVQLFAGSMAFLTDQEAVFSVPVKSTLEPAVTVPERSARTMGAVFMFILPGAVLLAGGLVFFRRRRL